MKKTAQQVINELPAECYGVLLMDKSLIKIEAGETGYHPLKNWENLMHAEECKNADQLADLLNERQGITKAQRKAMEWGSQFGYGTALSNPDNYDSLGNPIRKKVIAEVQDS